MVRKIVSFGKKIVFVAILLFSAAEQARAIALSKTKLVMAPGDYVLLEATVLPENAEDKTVEWFTSNPDAVVLGSMWSGIKPSAHGCASGS